MQLQMELRGVAAHSARSWMGHNAIHDAGGVLQRLASYQPQQIDVDGLTYQEGLNAIMISGGIAGNVIPDRCVIEINYRFAPDKSPAEAEAYVRRVLDGYPDRRHRPGSRSQTGPRSAGCGRVRARCRR